MAGAVPLATGGDRSSETLELRKEERGQRLQLGSLPRLTWDPPVPPLWAETEPPPPPPAPPTTAGAATSTAPTSSEFSTTKGGKQDPEAFPASTSYHEGTRTPKKLKSILAADRRQRQVFSPFDPSSVKIETRDSGDLTDTGTEASDDESDNSLEEEKEKPVVKSKTKGRRKLQKFIELSRPMGLDAPARQFQPGYWVYIKWWDSNPLRAKWRGPFQVLLTSLTASKVAGK
ncbi:hypothetical protein BTVI_138818 [Pitangus sulphuratus]|nr:hypothetical protein BTVI_138818 [Pitangus sulphuratus]